MRIENWYIDNEKETKYSHICGNVYGYDRLEDGTRITTSRLRSMENNVVVTEVGNTFVLGKKAQ